MFFKQRCGFKDHIPGAFSSKILPSIPPTNTEMGWTRKSSQLTGHPSYLPTGPLAHRTERSGGKGLTPKKTVWLARIYAFWLHLTLPNRSSQPYEPCRPQAVEIIVHLDHKAVVRMPFTTWTLSADSFSGKQIKIQRGQVTHPQYYVCDQIRSSEPWDTFSTGIEKGLKDMPYWWYLYQGQCLYVHRLYPATAWK